MSAIVRLHAGDPGPHGTENEVRDASQPYVNRGRFVGYHPAEAVFEFVNDDEIANESMLDFGRSTSDWGNVSHASVWWRGKCTNTVPLRRAQNCPAGVSVSMYPRVLTFPFNFVDDDGQL